MAPACRPMTGCRGWLLPGVRLATGAGPSAIFPVRKREVRGDAARGAVITKGPSMWIKMTYLVLGVSLLATVTSQAQKAAGISRVGWLEVCAPGPRRSGFDVFRARLAEQGYVEGKNLVIEQRFADCRYDRMPALAAELVQVPVDVLFTIGTRATRIVAKAVKTTPIVVYSCDPFAAVKQLARPVGNLTGVTCMTTELMPKRLELLKEAIPNASRVTLLQDPEAATNAFELTQEAAPRLGITMLSAQVAPRKGCCKSSRRSRSNTLTRCLCIPTSFSARILGLSSSPISRSRPICPRYMRSAST